MPVRDVPLIATAALASRSFSISWFHMDTKLSRGTGATFAWRRKETASNVILLIGGIFARIVQNSVVA